MYTQTQEERERLYTLIEHMVLPAIQRAIYEASELLVYDTEGFHPDSVYEDHIDTAADEITARLSEYFAGISYKQPDGLYAKVNAADLHRWLEHDR